MQARRDDGKKVFASSCNFNESRGLNFAEASPSGVPIDRDYVERPSSMGPLIEIMQAKGVSEAAPNFRPNDEFADFENAVAIQPVYGRGFVRETFVRYGLGRGIRHQADVGAKPSKHGFVGGATAATARPPTSRKTTTPSAATATPTGWRRCAPPPR